MTAPADLPALPVGYRERTEIHCHRCGHRVNVRRGNVCIAHGHVVSVVQLQITTANADAARPFTAEPAPYLGSTR